MVAIETLSKHGGRRDEIAAPRCLHVIDSMAPGGAQRVLQQLTGWLVEQGVAVGVVARDGLLRAALHPGIQFFTTEGRPRMSEIRQAIRDFSPTLLHAHQRREAFRCLLAAAPHGIPVVEHAHTVLPRSRLRSLSFRGCRVYAVGPEVADWVIDVFGRRPEVLEIVPNLPTVPIVDRVPDISRPDSERPLRILGMGRLTAQKDPLRFVAVVAALAELMPVEARWLGEGPLRGPAQDLANSLGAPVEFAGYSSQVMAELDDADVLLMTSRWEGVPLVALEAQARGRVVIATTASRVKVPEFAHELFIAPDDESAAGLAARIAAAFADPGPLERSTAAAHRLLRERCDPDAVYGAILADYRLLSGLPA